MNSLASAVADSVASFLSVADTPRPAAAPRAIGRDGEPPPPEFEVAATFDSERAILAREQMARKLAREFRSSRKYPIEAEELESEALLQLAQAAADFPNEDTILPFGAYAAQRIIWRLEDFIQAWYRLAVRDHAAGKDEVRRIVPIGPSAEAAKTPRGRFRARDCEPDRGLMIEDCQRMVATVLTPRQRAVIRMRFEEHKTLRDIASELDMTHIRVRQTYCEAVAVLRQAMDGIYPAHRKAAPRPGVSRSGMARAA